MTKQYLRRSNPAGNSDEISWLASIASSTQILRKSRTVVAMVPLVLILQFSRPDRGGVSRASKLFHLPNLCKHVASSNPIVPWSPFEDPKFVFIAKNEDLLAVKNYLISNGYTDWQSGGLAFGSISRGWENGSVETTMKQQEGRTYLWALDHAKNEVICVKTSR